jgi:hypothetical protein
MAQHLDISLDGLRENHKTLQNSWNSIKAPPKYDAKLLTTTVKYYMNIFRAHIWKYI